MKISDVEEIGQFTSRNASVDAQLSAVDELCLNFCISLLDHRITRSEYDSPLINALAVLDVNENQ